MAVCHRFGRTKFLHLRVEAETLFSDSTRRNSPDHVSVHIAVKIKNSISFHSFHIKSFFFRWGWDIISVELTGPVYVPGVIREWICSSSGVILSGHDRRTRRKTCPVVTLSTVIHTWSGLSANPGHRCEKPAANCLNCCTAEKQEMYVV
jgi:hypothetical protein